MSQYDYYSNKGGFSTDSPMSSPGGAARRPAAQHALRPVTIKQLLSATQSHADAEFKIDDVEIGQVTVVAQVVQVKNQATNSSYTLDDGGGRFEARHWTDASQSEEDNGIRENTYIRVMGTLKSFGGKNYINATHVRPCKDPHEPYAHVLECLTVTLSLQRGPPPQPGQQVVPATNTNGVSAYTAQASTAGVKDQWSFLPKLQQDIIRFILSQENHAEGIHISAIARHLQHEDAAKIGAALDILMDEGHVYTTVDESHFDVSV